MRHELVTAYIMYGTPTNIIEAWGYYADVLILLMCNGGSCRSFNCPGRFASSSQRPFTEPISWKSVCVASSQSLFQIANSAGVARVGDTCHFLIPRHRRNIVIAIALV